MTSEIREEIFDGGGSACSEYKTNVLPCDSAKGSKGVTRPSRSSDLPAVNLSPLQRQYRNAMRSWAKRLIAFRHDPAARNHCLLNAETFRDLSQGRVGVRFHGRVF